MEFNSRSVYLSHSAECADEGGSGQSEGRSDHRIVPVVLSGGGGSRLWPFSSKEMPKQFLPLIDNETLFDQALKRVSDRMRFTAPIVVGSIEHADICAQALAADGDAARLLLEPHARNTAPAIIMAAAVAQEVHGEEALLLVTPSDHLIKDVAAFHDSIDKGEAAARAGRLVTFGIRPSAPDTGYGYLQMAEDVPDAPGVKGVARFVEKPAAEVAEAMVEAGDYLWNAGIFLFPASTLLQQAGQTCPAILEAALMAVASADRDGIRVTPDAAVLSECPSESIDYAVMELSSQVAVVPMAPGWSDLGSWDALASLMGTASPIGPITTVDCESCYIRTDGVQVAALGVRDLIIVASRGRLLILPRGRSQEVKKLLSAMDSKAA